MCSKIPYKLFILFNFLLLTQVGTSQTNGLAVDMQYDQRIQDARYNRQQMEIAHAKRYKNLQDKYKYALGLNVIKDTPKELPASGTFDAVITDGGYVYDIVLVGVESNRIVYIKSSKGETVFPKISTDVVNFRSVITKKDGSYLELIFTYLFD